MSAIHQVLLAGGAAAYQVPYSLRFRAANSAYLNRTPASAGNRKTATISIWFKRGNISSAMDPLGVAAGNTEAIRFNAGNTLMIRFGNLDSTTNAVFRDPSGWGHLVVARDTTQATSTNRLLAWWNGVALTFSTYSVPAQNADTDLFNTVVHNLGASFGPGNIYDGYMAEVNFIDGQALTPSSFGQTDSATGVWVPKKYAGTYGTNGFYLKFADASAATATAIGKDSSGNGNNWTPSGISVTSGVTYDQMTDTPTLNYPVWNPLEYDAGLTTQSTPTFADANMKFTGTGGTNNVCTSRSSIGVKTGKWYWETVIVAIDGNYPVIGVMSLQPYDRLTSASSYMGQSATTTMGYSAGGSKLQSNSLTAYGNTFAANDVISVALDLDNQKIWFAKNGTWQASGDPAAGTNAAFSGFTVPTDGISAALSGYRSTGASGNFGQRPFSYTPPTGFKALNTANLATPSIKKGGIYFNSVLYTGTGSSRNVTGVGFQPDLVWIKDRTTAYSHELYDSVRGVQNRLFSNLTNVEQTAQTQSLTAFGSDGFTVGSDISVNRNTDAFVSWNWKEGATPGFDIVTWTADGTSPRNISHSLGAVPKLIITKQRSPSADNWFTYHASLGATKNVRLDETAAAQTQVGAWNNTEPTSTQFTTGNFVNFTTNGNTLVAYLWSEIEGFSKISSYTGNGSTDGPFVFCGFRPRYVLIKSTGTENWSVQDSARNPYNVVDARLKPNSADAEAVSSVQNVDFLSNGFKLRNTDTEKNGSGTTYIFAAFAENPFKYARAR